MEPKVVMAKAFAHKLATDMVREEMKWEEVVIHSTAEHPVLGRCFVGHFILGIGLFNVYFPVNAVRAASAEEITHLTTHRYGVGKSIRFRLSPSDFASQEELEAVRHWNINNNLEANHGFNPRCDSHYGR